VTFVEVKIRPDGTRQAFTCELVARSANGVVLRYVTRTPWRVDDLELRPGTVTYGYFWADRPYNVYHWVAPDGRTLGTYINLSGEVQIGADQLTWLDLAADVLVRPDHGPRVLDEDELALLPEPVRAQAQATLAHVLAHWPEIVGEVEFYTRRLHLTEGSGEPPGSRASEASDR
jgi:predicted RNA-binding protein associated with RNAse of E/G family